MAEISIIVPVYNVEKYLKRCVDSILAQTFSDFELILVDDGSEDNSGKICDEFQKADSRIKVIHKENGGLSSARNAGIEASTCDYIGFVDSDDFVAIDMYETLYGLITENNADVARIGWHEVETDEAQPKKGKGELRIFEGEKIIESFFDLKIESVCVGLYAKKVIGESRFPVGKTSEDIPFNFEIFSKAEKFAYMPCQKYFYFNNPVSISNGKMDEKKMNYVYFREEIADNPIIKNDKKLSKKAAVLCARAYMGILLRMAIYGVADGFDEMQTVKTYQKKLKDNLCLYLRSVTVPLSRKIAGLMVATSYKLTRMLLRGKRK